MSEEWLKHDGGENPAPGKLVDLVYGIGIVESQPSDRVNWFFKWLWKLSPGQDALPVD